MFPLFPLFPVKIESLIGGKKKTHTHTQKYISQIIALYYGNGGNGGTGQKKPVIPTIFWLESVPPGGGNRQKEEDR